VSGEIGGRVIGADTAFASAQDHVEHPVEAIVERPVAGDDPPGRMRPQHQGRNVKALIPLDLPLVSVVIDAQKDALQSAAARSKLPK